jgi:hypothetical protein
MEKEVTRLSLKFKSEDRKEFDYRKNLCESRRAHVFEHKLFKRYVDNIPSTYVTHLKDTYWENKIFNYTKFSTKRLASKYNNLFTYNNPSFAREVDIVEQDFLRQMKKVRLVLEMEQPYNYKDFLSRSLRLRNFYQKVSVPAVAIKTNRSHKESFNEKIKILSNKSMYFQDSAISEILIKFLKECEAMKKTRLILHTIDESKLPLNKAEFIKIRNYYNTKTEEYIHNNCHFNLKNLIVENLKKKDFEFCVLNIDIYRNSKEQKILQFFNFILRQKIQELVDNSIISFMNLIKKYRSCNYDKGYYEESHSPLFLTKLVYNKPKPKKNEQPDKSKVIKFNPSSYDYDGDLLEAFKHVKNVINKIQDLMSSSIMLTKLPEKRVFELTEDYPLYVECYSLLKEVSKTNSEQLNKIKDLFKPYESLLLYPPGDYIKSSIRALKKQAEEKGEHVSDEFNVDYYSEFLEKLYVKDKALDEIDNEINLLMYKVQTDELKKDIKERINDIKKEAM